MGSKNKDAYYFSHDSNARNDEKMLMLRAKHGWEGCGVFWALIEMMFESADTALSHSREEGIALNFAISSEKMSEILATCIEQGLFKSDGHQFWSESLRRRKGKYTELKKKRAKAGKLGMKARWGSKKSEEKPEKEEEDTVSVDCSRYKSAWNELASECKALSSKRKINSTHRGWIASREKQNEDFYGDFLEALDKIGKSPNIQKQNWLNFEFLIAQKNAQSGVEKILEGKYDWMEDKSTAPKGNITEKSAVDYEHLVEEA